jgi:hypothetical protein
MALFIVGFTLNSAPNYQRERVVNATKKHKTNLLFARQICWFWFALKRERQFHGLSSTFCEDHLRFLNSDGVIPIARLKSRAK